MNWTIVEGKWAQAKADLKTHWARLTDHDVEILEAKKDKLVGKIVERYGVLKEEAEKQVDEWMHKLESRLDHASASAKEHLHRSH